MLRDGDDVLAPLLRDPGFHDGTLLRLFDPELIEAIGMWPNEYLSYYYHAERALEAIRADGRTRGEELLEWNRKLLDQLRSVDAERNPQAARKVYDTYMRRRIGTYMEHGESNESTVGITDVEADEGYAGVALDVITGRETGEPLYTALNVPNEGAIGCMRSNDVVEVSCRVDREGVHPESIGAIPEPQELLMRTVKLYERMAIESILARSRVLAARALMVHPLVLSYSRATRLVNGYLAAHAGYVGDWE